MDKIQPYLRAVADRLRAVFLDAQDALPGRARTKCSTEPLSRADSDRAADAAAAYYLQPTPDGVEDATGPAWFDAFVDNPSLPSPNCDPKTITGDNGLFCFSSACVPPSVAGFSCGPADP